LVFGLGQATRTEEEKAIDRAARGLAIELLMEDME